MNRTLLFFGVAASLVIAMGCGSSTPIDPTGGRVIDSSGCTPLGEGVSIAGRYIEDARIDCATGDFVPGGGIGELNLLEGSTIEVTWTPFETYVDWWGRHFYAPEGGIEIVVDGGNYIPPDVDGEGCVSLDDEGRLVLTDVWLGTGPAGSTPASPPTSCGYRFVAN